MSNPAHPTSLPLYTSPETLDFEALAALPKHPLDRDWYGNRPVAESTFVLALDPANLWFSAECRQTPDFDRQFGAGDFVEGLWQHDVAELFLVEDRTERYQEFNLSPSGAWWSGVFDSYREAGEAFNHKLSAINSCANVEQNSWSAAIRIPRASLAIAIEFGPRSKANVSMIIGGGARQCLSWSKIAADKPDFHRFREFVCLEKR